MGYPLNLQFLLAVDALIPYRDSSDSMPLQYGLDDAQKGAQRSSFSEVDVDTATEAQRWAVGTLLGSALLIRALLGVDGFDGRQSPGVNDTPQAMLATQAASISILDSPGSGRRRQPGQFAVSFGTFFVLFVTRIPENEDESCCVVLVAPAVRTAQTQVGSGQYRPPTTRYIDGRLGIPPR